MALWLKGDTFCIMLSINTNCKLHMVFKNTQSLGSRPEPAPRQAARKENPMNTLPLDLLVALSPFIVLGILSLIGK